MIRIDGSIRIPVSAVPAPVLAELGKRATVIEQRRERSHGGGELRWVQVPRELSAIDCDGNLVLPRGMTNDVRELCAGIPVTLATTTARRTFVPQQQWRTNQIECAAALGRFRQMIALGATGSGKTGAGCASIAASAQKTLILVPTVDLAHQWAREVFAFLNVRAGVCTAGAWHDADVVIATPQTANGHIERLQTFGLLIVDEVQAFTTEIRCDLVGEIPALYRLALTATLPDDHRGAVIRAHFGEVRQRYSVSDGTRDGVIVAPRYEQIATSFQAPYESDRDWSPLLEALIADEERNELIVETVIMRCAGACTLVLTQRIAHIETLASMLDGQGPRVGVLHGSVAKAQRERVLADAREGRINVLVASTVADEGIDLPMLGALVMAFPSKSEPRLLQRIGRVLRAAPGKQRPLVFDFVDDVGPLRAQAKHRAETFARTFGLLPGVAA